MSQRIDLEQMHMTGQMATAALPLALFLQSAKKSVVDFWSSVTHTLGHVADCSGLSSVVGVTCQADAEITGVDASAALPSRPIVDDGKGRPISSTSQMVLRLCIHHGEDLPLDKSYLEVVIQESASEIKTLKSLAASSSSNPVWDFLVEEKVEVRANRVPNILIKVLSWQLIGPREIGSAFLMASVHGDQVHQQELTLKPADSIIPSLTKPKASKLMVAWQLCDESAFKPDLSRVAEMSSLALSKRFFRMEVAVKRIQLSKALVGAIPGVDLHSDDFWDHLPDMFAQISCLKLDEAGKKEEAVIYQEYLKVEALQKRGKGKHHVLFKVKEETYDGDDDDDGKRRSRGKRKIERHLKSWELLENEISLMNYEVHFKIIMTSKTNHRTAQEPVLTRKVLGSWKGSLANLYDKISNSQRKEHFAAQLLTNHHDKMRVGLMEVIFDINQTGADLHDEALIRRSLEDGAYLPPVNAGDYNQDWSSQGTFHVEAMACGLRMPFPKIKVFSAHAQSQELTLDTEFVDKDKWLSTFSGSVPVSVSKTRQNVRFEVWSGGNNLIGEERLIGETSVYAAGPGRMEWKHLYGGALQSNYKKSEEQMNRGRMTPSTYRGSLFLRFSSRPTTGESLREVTKTKIRRGYLQVKLYRGIYLAGFEGKEVSVLIQLPGCAIPDPRNQSRNNFNLLSFPAKVDNKGTMTFLTEDGSFMPWSREAHGWVQRSTSKERKDLLKIPEAVNAARFYIVKRGDEDKPPEAFGRLLISMDEEREAKWMRVTWDQSVVKLPETDRLFKDDLVGYILGSATVVCPHYESNEDKNEVTETDAPHGALSEIKMKLHEKAEETQREVAQMVKSVERVVVQPVMIKPGSVLCQPCMAERVMQVGDSGYDVQSCPQHRVQMWCHIDMLAARCLPTADPDGLGDVCYEIEVGEEGGLFDAERIRSLNPSFLHRLVIGPLWVEVKPQVKFDKDGLKEGGLTLEPKDLLDLPPIVVRVLDWDEGDSYVPGDSYELMGRAVVPNPDFLDTKGVVSEEDDGQGPVKVLDVNQAHSPAWYSLEFEGQTRFIRSNAGATCDESWQNRPRLLMAAGYSFCPRWKTEKDEHISWERTSGKKCTMARIRSEEKVSYNITLDVLGLRHMGNIEKAFDDGMDLQISSYWSSGTNPKLRLKDGINPASTDRTFRGKGSVQQEPDFVKCLEGLVKFQAESLSVGDGEESVSIFSPRSDFDGEKSMTISHSRVEEASALESRGALLVDAESVVGWRAKLPQYTIPVIPYLQKNRDDFQMAFTTEEREAPDPPVEGATTLAVKKRERKHISGSDTPFVLLPDIIFQLLDGQKDQGTLCVHLPAKYGLLRQAERSVIRKAIRTRMIVKKWDQEGTDYLKLECGDMVEVLQHDIKTGWAHGKKVKSARGEPVEGEGHEGWFPDWAVDPASDKSWVELAAEEFSNLDQELRNLRRLDVLADPGDACDFYVDVFASKPGMIKWNPKLQLGRCLLQQHLFSITPEDEDQDEDVYFFNPADTLFDDPLRKDEPFDNRFCPTFSCKTVSRTQNGTTTKVRSTDKPKLVWWNKQQEDFYQAERAQETEKVMERIESEGTSTASGMSPQGHLDVEPETIPLKELCYRAALKGMRLVSKQHVPEICLPAPRQNFGPEMEEIHNQTFMVPLGHEITRDPTTWRLARLKMGRIETAKKKKKDPIEVRSVDGSTYTFSLYSSTMIKICKDSDFQRAIPVHRSLRVTEEGGKRFVEVSADREPIQVAPDQFKQLNKALDLFRIGAAEAQNAYLEAEEKPPPNDNETPAYLNIRYRRYGTVVWVAPMEVFEWQETGSLLFVVQERSGKHVAVRLPCFDLRFPQETSWFTAKIITGKAEVSEMGYLAAQQQEMRQKGKSNVGSYRHQEKSEINVIRDHTMVQRNSFCCRIKMMNVKGQSSRFCRPRTSNWYRSVLSSVFPEVDKLQKVHPSMDKTLVKHFFLMRQMNLRQPMITPDKQKACLLKGHVSVSQVMSEDDKVEEESRYQKMIKDFKVLLGSRSRSDEEPDVKKEETSLLPWSHLWVQSNVKMRINVLTVRGLLLDSNLSLKDVQVVMSLSGRQDRWELAEKTFDATVYEADGRGFDIYSSVLMDALLVGEAFLSIEVRSKSSWASSHVPLGRAQIDLEDRWFALQQRRLRQASNKHWIKANRSAPAPPPEDTRWSKNANPNFRGEADGGHDQHHDYLVTAFVQPIETVRLYDPDPLFEDRPVGSLRMWVDMVDENQQVPEVEYRSQDQVELELRIRVKEVDGITVFKDFGERNDVYVKAEVQIQSPGQTIQTKTFKTDTHSYARYKASFNWQWVFRVSAPAHFCSVEFFIIDEDSFTSNQLIYESKVVALEEFIVQAHRRHSRGQVVQRTVQHQVLFETPAEGREEDDALAVPDIDPQLQKWRDRIRRRFRRCTACLKRCCKRCCSKCCSCLYNCCCCPPSFEQKHKPAVMKLEVAILSEGEAALDPVLRESGHFAEPKDRGFNLTSALTEPRKFFYNYIGPKNYFEAKRGVYCVTCLVCSLLILAVIYLALQIFLPSLELKEKLAG